MKRMICLCLLALLLAGCSTAPKQENNPVQIETGTPIEALNAYETVLKQYYESHINGTGEEIWFDASFGILDDNRFAIADVDGDGTDELLLEFSTAPTAGMCTWVYGWDRETKTVIEELAAFPGLTWYTGGLVEAEWSHNQGLAGDALWPYTLLRYDAESRTFQMVAQVDAWSRDMSEKDYEGNPFPEDIDTDKTGVVYLVTKAGAEGAFETETMSRTAYDAWHESMLGDAKVFPISYMNTTLDNINTASPE